MSLNLNKLANKLDEALSNETSETLTKFLKDKTMSNNKQSSLDYYITKLTEILGPEIIKQISRDDNERIARLEKQAKAMHKEEIMDANFYGQRLHAKSVTNTMMEDNAEQYYNETFNK